MNQVRRLSKREESVLHQEILAVFNEQQEKMYREKWNNLVKLASTRVQEQLCSEWGRV